MLRSVLCFFVVMTFACSSFAQRAPARKPTTPAQRQPAPGQVPTRAKPSTPTASAKRNGESGPERPSGFKPVSLATAQKETERLKGAIEKLEQRLNAKQQESAAGDEAEATTAASKETADAKPVKASASAGKADDAAPKSVAEKRTVAGVEIENRSLRRQVDALLVKVAELEGTIPARPANAPKYDPHVIDSPTNAEFCPGKTLEQLEDTMRFAGFPVGESDDGRIVYEWIFHVTNAKRSAHVTHRIWAVMKDGVAADTKQAAPGVVTEGPPPKFTPTR